MHRNERNQKQGDKLLKMPGKLDRGPVDFKSRIAGKESEILAVGSREVVSVPPTMSILGAIEEMETHGFRRLPVTDPGTHKIRGIVTAGDIISFMGGGDKYNLVQVKHKGNLLAAINESIREIMTQNLFTMNPGNSVYDVIDTIVNNKVGGLPVVDDQHVLRGIITERDVLKVLSAIESAQTVENVMSTSLHVISPDSPLSEATRSMISHHFRRLPVVSGDVLFGIITATDIIHYIGSGEVFGKLETGDASDVMGLPVRTLINGTLHTTTPDKNITETAHEMLDKGVGALPVIENARLVGLVTEFDLVKALAER